MTTISLSVPRDDKEALVAGATMLLTLAGKVPTMELEDAIASPAMSTHTHEVAGLHIDHAAPYGVLADVTPAGPFYWHDPSVLAAGVCATIEEFNGACALNPSILECSAEEFAQDVVARFAISNPHGFPLPEVTAAVPPPPTVNNAGTPAPPVSTTETAPASAGAVHGASPSDGVELDADGLPWDMRIHAGTKTKTVDGRWKKKPGGPKDAELAAIEAELRAVMSAGSGSAIPTPAEPSQALPVTPGITTESASEAVPPVPNVMATFAAGAVESSIPVPPATNVPSPVNFPQFLKASAALVNAQASNMEAITGKVQEHGIPNMQMVGARPDLIPPIWASIWNSLDVQTRAVVAPAVQAAVNG